jgi:hypothetical protein
MAHAQEAEGERVRSNPVGEEGETSLALHDDVVKAIREGKDGHDTVVPHRRLRGGYTSRLRMRSKTARICVAALTMPLVPVSTVRASHHRPR